jgi:DNA (cytosine-5)-methyltransferase 1
MAGCRVLWANEFIPAARATYQANHPETPLDPRDIRQVRPEDILDATGLKPGDLDLFDGSPPCASFSTAGKREAGWGKVKDYSDTRQRTDDLFFEYARLVKGVRPKVFVAENVSGLVKGKAKGYFLEILAALKACGYRVKAKLLDAQWLGVPQMRQRIIFVGVRDDFGLEPAFPRPLPYRYSVREAIPWIVRQGDSGGFGGGALRDAAIPSPTVGASPNAGNGRAPASLVEAETDISRFAIGREWDRVAPGGKSEKYLNLCKPDLDKPCNTVTAPAGMTSAATVVHPTEKRRFSIAELKRICAFPDDFILTGTYAQQWERLGRAVPPLMMKAVAEAIRDVVLCKLPR